MYILTSFGFCLVSHTTHTHTHTHYTQHTAGADAPPMLVYRPFDSWAANGDWSVQLPADEAPLCVASAIMARCEEIGAEGEGLV